MKFDIYPRTEYEKNTLFEVLLQARFPEILKISTEPPVEFQDRLRKVGFPETISGPSELPPDMPDKLRAMLIQEEGYKFCSEDFLWQVALKKNFIALTCFDYTEFAKFKEMLEKVLPVFEEVYEPPYFNRLGLRYKNMANATVLEDENVNVEAFVHGNVAPELTTELSEEIVGLEKSVLYEDDFCTSNVRHVLGHLTGDYGKYTINDEKSYIIDIDCFINSKFKDNQELLETARKLNEEYIRNIFHGSITEDLRKAMRPV